MQNVVISGNLGRDAELRQTQGGDDILVFSVAVKQGYGDRASSNWYRCNVWGKRARSLQQHLLKGMKVVVAGELTIGEYQGKPQYDVRVNDVEFTSRGEPRQERDEPARGGGGGSSYDPNLDDDIPFASCDPRRDGYRRAVA